QVDPSGIRPAGEDLPEGTRAGRRAVGHPELGLVAALVEEERPVAGREQPGIGIAEEEGVAAGNAVELHADRPAAGAVRLPELQPRTVRGIEQKAAGDLLEIYRRGAARPGAQVADPALVSRRAVGGPQLPAGEPVVRREEDLSAEDPEGRRVRAATARADVGHAPSAG